MNKTWGDRLSIIKQRYSLAFMNVLASQTQTHDFLDTLKSIIGNFEAEDRTYITTEISWQDYEQINERFIEQSHYRTAYFNGTLAIMSPGRNHEKAKEYLSSLLEAYLQEAEIDYYPLGSTTLKIESQQAGKEPDSCYCIETEKEFPDLAIEVVFSSGGIDSLAIYKALQIKEVWFWQNKQLKIYCLNDQEYQEVNQSKILPNLDIELLAKYISTSNIRLAIKEYRQELKTPEL